MGVNMSSHICGNCGYQIKDYENMHFCPKCGAEQSINGKGALKIIFLFLIAGILLVGIILLFFILIGFLLTAG